jgi:hypothetical protein
MAFTAIIKITDVGIDAGPVFDIYSDVDGFTTPFENNIPKASLIAGYLSINIPDGTTQIKVVSDGVLCDTEVIVNIPTTTTTTFLPCFCYEIDTIGGNYDVSYINCSQKNLVTEVMENERVSVCAVQDSITYIGAGSITVDGGLAECDGEEECFQAFIVEAAGINAFFFRLIESTFPFIVDWGDGTSTSFPAGYILQADVNKHIYNPITYPAGFTGQIKVKSRDLGGIKILRTDTAGFTTGSATILGTELIKLYNLKELHSIKTNLVCTAIQFPRTLLRLTSYIDGVSGSVADLPRNMVSINMQTEFTELNTLSGNVSQLPPLLNTCIIHGRNTITGDMANVPVQFKTTMQFIDIRGFNTIDGDASIFTTWGIQFKYFSLWGYNTFHGDVAGFSGLVEMTGLLLHGYNYPTGNLSAFTPLIKLKTLLIYENFNAVGYPPSAGNTLTGNIADLPRTLTTTGIYGKNTITGNLIDIPNGNGIVATYFDIRGRAPGGNTLTGNFIDIPSNVTKFYIESLTNTITGALSDLPSGLTTFVFSCAVNNGVTGDISDFPSGVNTISLTGNHAVQTYLTPKTWANPMYSVQIIPAAAYNIPTVQLDQLLIDFDQSQWLQASGSPKRLWLKGTRSNVSDSAFNSLTITKDVDVAFF